jgi:hypothetical protein
MIRQPVVAGQFYPASAKELRSVIASMVDEKAEKRDVIGVVSPHAGYVYSGPVAGAVLSRIKFKDTFILLGPSHTGRGKPFSIMTEGSWQTPLGQVEIDSELGKKILESSGHLREDAIAHQYEHSIEVQVPFLQYFKPEVHIVPIVLGHASGDIYKEIGKEIAKVIKESKREVVIMASSDMTHYELQEVAAKKDKAAIEAMLALDEDGLLKRVEELGISMCGYAPVVALIAAAKELGAKSAELVKYQTSGDTTGDFSSVVGYAGIIIPAGEGMHPIAALAKEAVESYVREGKVIAPPTTLTPEMESRAGVFVTLHKFGELRGCIGTFEPTTRNVASEIIQNAISSSTRDPRFPPVAPNELEDIEYHVDVLTSPKLVKDKGKLDPKKYGVIAECGWRRGLLLPDLEEVDTVERQVEICCLKAGIAPDEPIKLYSFEVKRYK